MKPVIIFDADDTLWRSEPLYDEVLRRAAERVEAAGIPAMEWLQLQRKIDLHNVRSMGLSLERFPLSSRQATMELGHSYGVTAVEELAREVHALSATVFTARAENVPGAQVVLQELQPYFHLALLTKGDLQVQEQRLAHSGLASYFEHVAIVGDKSPDRFLDVVRHFNAKAESCWSIGNSAPSDINPALEAGLNAIWIDAHVWEHERRETVVQHHLLLVLGNLSEVPGAVLGARCRVEEN